MGELITAYGQIEAGREAEATAKYNQALQEQQAREIERTTRFRQERQAEAGVRAISKLRAGLGAAGAVTTTGAPLMLEAKQASEFELENLMIGRAGIIGAERARAAGRMERYRGKVAKRAAYIGAGTTLLTGFAEMDWGGGKKK